MQERVFSVAADYRITVWSEALVSSLSMGENQQVKILKLLYRQSSILIFEETTAVLVPLEAEKLFAAMRRMADAGQVVFRGNPRKAGSGLGFWWSPLIWLTRWPCRIVSG